MASGKMPSLGEVAAASGGNLADNDADDSSSYDVAIDELAEVIGVSEDKLSDFREAFKAAVASCM